jgi:hypothetical protein
MAETQVGVARIFGVKNATVSVGAVTIENADLEHKFHLDESKGQDGDTETAIASDEQFDLTINFMPHSGAAVIPEPLATITISGFEMADLNRNYRYIGGGSVKQVRDKECVAGLKLRSWAGIP